jgi:glycosyltransferase involved in cell wall biosynthesis
MISVCIATYNGEKYILEQLKSIISQLSPSDEIIISDDNSNDNTLELIRSLKLPMIRIFNNKKEHGYTSNFENALMHAHGDYIFVSDQDDVWIDKKVRVCLNYLKRYDFVVSDAIITDSALSRSDYSYFQERNPYKSLIGNIIKFGYLGCCMAFKRELLNMALPFPHKHKLCTHDNWLLLVALSSYKVKIINERLIYYRRHDNNTSSGGFLNTTSFMFKIKYRLYLMFHVFCRYIKKI